MFGVDKMDLNGVVLTAQFRTVSGGQYAVNRAFNLCLKKLVDNCPWVHFAQTYPQQVLMHERHADKPEDVAQQDDGSQDDSVLVMPKSPLHS